MIERSKCELCGEPMPAGEEMFKFHGYSGPCPKPPLPPKRDVDHPAAEIERLLAEVDRLNGLLVRSMFAEKRADEKRAAAEEARDVAEALLLQLSTTHRCTPGEMRKSCKRYLQGREPKIISVLKHKLRVMAEQLEAAEAARTTPSGKAATREA